MKTKILILILMLCSLCAYALEVPALTSRVMDTADIMQKGEIDELEEYLKKIEDSTTVQIAVLTIKSLEGESLEEYSMRVVENWKLGQKDKDNGALLLIAYQEHKIRIEVGYGLEGLLTDTKSGLIIRNIIAPEFQEGNFGEGIIKGAKMMASIAIQDAELESELDTSSGDDFWAIFVCFIPLMFFLLVFFCEMRKKKLYGPNYNPRPIRTYSDSGSLYGGHHSHGSSFSGGFGGGFSGGGGGFGGGGASGGW